MSVNTIYNTKIREKKENTKIKIIFMYLSNCCYFAKSNKIKFSEGNFHVRDKLNDNWLLW